MIDEFSVRALVRRFYDPFRDGDMTVFDEILADAWRNDPADPRGGDPRTAMRANVSTIRAALPDLRHEQETVIVGTSTNEDVIAAVRSKLSGTQTGTFLGVEPTGRTVVLRTMDMHRLTPDNRIIETWHLEDFLGLYRQLGVNPKLH